MVYFVLNVSKSYPTHYVLNPLLFECSVISLFYCCLLIFPSKLLFSKKEYDQCQTVWMKIRPDILSDQIWVQTFCKGYQQKTLADKE